MSPILIQILGRDTTMNSLAWMAGAVRTQCAMHLAQIYAGQADEAARGATDCVAVRPADTYHRYGGRQLSCQPWGANTSL